VSWSGRTVLVTGAGGFIGSHLVEHLVEAGATVRAFVHYNALNTAGWLDESGVKGRVEVVPGDIRDRDSLSRAMPGVDVVFHLAALIGIPYSYTAPASYVSTNVVGTLNVLQAARNAGVARVVHTSTSEVYGTARYVPIDEEHRLQAQSPYAATKIAADKLAESFHLSFSDMPVVIVRPFNTFGPRQSVRAVIPTIITQCLKGQVVKLGNTHPRRDLNFVTNIVEGFMLGGSVPGIEGRTFNLGSGTEISVGILGRLIGDLLGKQIVIEQESERQRPERSEVDRLVADNSLAATVLGWTPAVSLEDGLRRTIAWVTDHQERFAANAYVV
jgi:NAD dependent epimerase/dehydratase